MAVAKLSSRGIIYTYTTNNEALAAATAECVLQLRTGSNNRARILYWSVSFDSTSASAEPVDVQFCRFSTTGTSGANANGIKIDPSSGTSDAAGHKNFSSQPTAGDMFWEGMVHPQGGSKEIWYNEVTGPICDVSSQLGIRVTAAAVVNCSATIMWEQL